MVRSSKYSLPNCFCTEFTCLMVSVQKRSSSFIPVNWLTGLGSRRRKWKASQGQCPSSLHLESGSNPCPHLFTVSILVSPLKNNASSQLGKTQISIALSFRYLKICKEKWPLFSYCNFKWKFPYYIVFNSDFFFWGEMERTVSCSVKQLKYSAKTALMEQTEPLGYQLMNTQLVA